MTYRQEGRIQGHDLVQIEYWKQGKVSGEYVRTEPMSFKQAKLLMSGGDSFFKYPRSSIVEVSCTKT